VLRWAIDEDFNGRIVRGLLRRVRTLDLVRIQDVGLSGASDADVLEFAADDKRLLLTHDARTMPLRAYARVMAGNPMPGVVVCGQDVPIRQAIEDIILLDEASDAGEWDGVVMYLPL
jgi:predicted nuclease of predicted toxin-antitoxin system